MSEIGRLVEKEGKSRNARTSILMPRKATVFVEICHNQH
jgi:hypothetical protein